MPSTVPTNSEAGSDNIPRAIDEISFQASILALNAALEDTKPVPSGSRQPAREIGHSAGFARWEDRSRPEVR
jgi:hypothetical protein